jgi:hypothetical protein
MQSSTIHIKVTPELAKALKSLSHKRGTSVSELVRQAILSCYQLEILIDRLNFPRGHSWTGTSFLELLRKPLQKKLLANNSHKPDAPHPLVIRS